MANNVERATSSPVAEPQSVGEPAANWLSVTGADISKLKACVVYLYGFQEAVLTEGEVAIVPASAVSGRSSCENDNNEIR